MLGTVFYIPSGKSNTAMKGKKNCLPIFDRVLFQGEEEFEQSQTHFGSQKSALSVDIYKSDIVTSNGGVQNSF